MVRTSHAASYSYPPTYRTTQHAETNIARLINYTPQATIVRVLTINAVNAYITSTVLSLFGGFRDARLLLPGWIGIATVCPPLHLPLYPLCQPTNQKKNSLDPHNLLPHNPPANLHPQGDLHLDKRLLHRLLPIHARPPRPPVLPPQGPPGLPRDPPLRSREDPRARGEEGGEEVHERGGGALDTLWGEGPSCRYTEGSEGRGSDAEVRYDMGVCRGRVWRGREWDGMVRGWDLGRWAFVTLLFSCFGLLAAVADFVSSIPFNL